MMFSRQGVYHAVLFAGVLGAVAYCQATFAAINLHDGEWEVTTSFQSGPPAKITECLTKDTVMNKEQDQPGCKSDQKVKDNTVTMHKTCNRNGSKEETLMEETFAGDSLKGTLRVKVTDPSGKVMSATGMVTGRRVGACKAAGKAP